MEREVEAREEGIGARGWCTCMSERRMVVCGGGIYYPVRDGEGGTLLWRYRPSDGVDGSMEWMDGGGGVRDVRDGWGMQGISGPCYLYLGKSSRRVLQLCLLSRSRWLWLGFRSLNSSPCWSHFSHNSPVRYGRTRMTATPRRRRFILGRSGRGEDTSFLPSQLLYGDGWESYEFFFCTVLWLWQWQWQHSVVEDGL